MKTEAQIKAMNATEQKAYAKLIGAEIKGNPGEDTIIARIMEKQYAPDFIDPEPEEEIAPVELDAPEFDSPVMTLDNGAQYTSNQVVQAAQRDSGLTPEEWNKLSDKKTLEKVQEFIDKTNFVAEPEEEEVETPKDHKKRLEEIMKDYPEVDFEVESNFYTIRYRGQVYSGNVEIPENVLRRQVEVMISS